MGRRVITPAAHQPPTPFTYSKTRFYMRAKGAREAQTNTHQQTTTTTAKLEVASIKYIYRCRPIQALVVGQTCIDKRSLSAIHVKMTTRRKYKCDEAYFESGRVCRAFSGRINLFKAQHRGTHLLGARRLTQAQSTLFKPLSLGRTSANQAQRD